MLHFEGQMPCERIVAFLAGLGLAISKRQVVRLLAAKLDGFRAEDEAVLRAGLAGAPFATVDDTGARHAGKACFTTHIGSDRFAAFRTGPGKSRLAFLMHLAPDGEPHIVRFNADEARRGRISQLAPSMPRAIILPEHGWHVTAEAVKFCLVHNIALASVISVLCNFRRNDARLPAGREQVWSAYAAIRAEPAGVRGRSHGATFRFPRPPAPAFKETGFETPETGSKWRSTPKNRRPLQLTPVMARATADRLPNRSPPPFEAIRHGGDAMEDAAMLADQHTVPVRTVLRGGDSVARDSSARPPTTSPLSSLPRSASARIARARGLMSPTSATCSRHIRMRAMSAWGRFFGGWRPMTVPTSTSQKIWVETFEFDRLVRRLLDRSQRWRGRTLADAAR